MSIPQFAMEITNPPEVCKNLMSLLDKTENILTNILATEYTTLSLEDKVRHDLYLSYCLNSLMWVYLKSNGIKPAQTRLKNEIDRLKEYITEFQQLIEKLTNRPVLNKPAAKRFIRNALFDEKTHKKQKCDRNSSND